MKKSILATVLTIVFLISSVSAQETPTGDFFNQIKNYDLSEIWMTDTFLADEALDFDGSIHSENIRTVERSEIVGFIGDHYQRLQIHFISIIQNPFDPYEYFAYGKTKVREYICPFQGKIRITRSQLYTKGEIPAYRQGFVESEVTLYEDSKQHSTGFFTGKLTTRFVIDDKGIFRYDALSFSSDSFCNNQFTGIWTSYRTKSEKICNWGDYRIPESGDLDVGTAEFHVNDKYVKNGWEARQEESWWR